jgi:AsmA protein
MMHGLAGSGTVSLRNGAIRGVDLGLVAKTIQTVLAGGATSQGSATRFSSLSGSFTIAGGILHNKDFKLTGPVLTAGGQGEIDLGNRTLDFNIKPVAAVAGKSGLGVPVPFRVTGSWSNLHYIPDLAGIVGGVLQGLGSGASSLTNILGGSAPKKNQKAKQGVGDTLKGVFGFH